jgi:hypothetical protein
LWGGLLRELVLIAGADGDDLGFHGWADKLSTQAATGGGRSSMEAVRS